MRSIASLRALDYSSSYFGHNPYDAMLQLRGTWNMNYKTIFDRYRQEQAHLFSLLLVFFSSADSLVFFSQPVALAILLECTSEFFDEVDLLMYIDDVRRSCFRVLDGF